MVGTQENDEILSIAHEIFAEKIAFNKVLGLEIKSLQHDRPSLRFKMRDELVGNFVHGTLHGGVISAVLDVTGGVVAFLGMQRKIRHEPLDIKIDRFSKLGTIDLRVDYLRPGSGNWFVSTGYILRTGNRVAVTRMELHNDKNILIAVGTGAYSIA